MRVEWNGSVIVWFLLLLTALNFTPLRFHSSSYLILITFKHGWKCGMSLIHDTWALSLNPFAILMSLGSPERNSTPWFYFILLYWTIHCSFADTDATVIILKQVTAKHLIFEFHFWHKLVYFYRIQETTAYWIHRYHQFGYAGLPAFKRGCGTRWYSTLILQFSSSQFFYETDQNFWKILSPDELPHQIFILRINVNIIKKLII